MCSCPRHFNKSAICRCECEHKFDGPFPIWICMAPEDFDYAMRFDPATEIDTGQGASPADLALALHNFVESIRDLLRAGRED